MPANIALDRTAQQRGGCWVPSSLRSSAAGQRERYASGLTYHLWYRHNVTCGELRSIGVSRSRWMRCQRTFSSVTRNG